MSFIDFNFPSIDSPKHLSPIKQMLMKGEDRIENLFPKCFQETLYQKKEIYTMLLNFRNEAEWLNFFILNFESKFRGK